MLEFNESQWLKQHVKCNTQKRTDAEKNGDKDGRWLYKLINNTVYEKTMENLRNRIDVKLANNKKWELFKVGIQTKLPVKQNI